MKKLPIHAHLAHTLDSRLPLLRHEPKHICIDGADGAHSRRVLSARYPHAQILEMDTREKALAQSKAEYSPSRFKIPFTKEKHQYYQYDSSQTLSIAPHDMLWSNLGLLHSPDVLSSLKNWARCLRLDGVLFFSHLGRDSFPEIRDLLAQHGIECKAKALMDMHDLADMLHDNGFYDPVTDTARLVLDYQRPDVLMHDLDDLNAWQMLAPNDEPRAREIVAQAVSSGSLKITSLETVLGHALKRAQGLAENEALVRFYPHKKP